MKGASRSIARSSIEENLVSNRDNRYIRASSIGFCKRHLGYQLLGYQPAPESGHSLFTLDLGNAIHDLLQRKLVNLGWIKAKPFLNDYGQIDWEQIDPDSGCELTMIDHGLRIIGHCDGITVPMKVVPDKEGLDHYLPDPDGERYLIEIKSITDRSNFWIMGIMDGGTDDINENDYEREFIRLDYEDSDSGMKQKLYNFSHYRIVKGMRGPQKCPVYKVKINGSTELVTILLMGHSAGKFTSLKKPKPEHVSQASIYAKYFGLKKILFLYVGKDVDSRNYGDEDLLNYPIKIFEVPVNDLVLDSIKEKIEVVYDYVDDEKLPSPDYTYDEDKSPCKWCPFLWQCQPDKVDIDSMQAKLSTLGFPEMKPGPGIVHTAKKNLEEDYNNLEDIH